MSSGKPPKVVLFDLGKVLVDFDWSIAARAIARQSDWPAPELMERMRQSPLLPRYERGQINSQRFYAEAQRILGYRGTFDEFAHSFAAIFSEIPEMIALQRRVRAAGFPTWIFSNTNDLAVAYIRRAFPFYANFDGYFLSYELGQVKPEPAIYETAEARTGCTGPEILYLDDFPENVAAGAQRGWQTIHHVSPAETIPRVECALGLAESS